MSSRTEGCDGNTGIQSSPAVPDDQNRKEFCLGQRDSGAARGFRCGDIQELGFSYGDNEKSEEKVIRESRVRLKSQPWAMACYLRTLASRVYWSDNETGLMTNRDRRSQKLRLGIPFWVEGDPCSSSGQSRNRTSAHCTGVWHIGTLAIARRAVTGWRTEGDNKLNTFASWTVARQMSR